MLVEVKIVIDSIFEELVRVRISSNKERKTLNVTIKALSNILENSQIEEGHSYRIIFDNREDFDDFWSSNFDEDFVLKGDKKVVETTKEDLDRLRRLQRKLGLRRSRR
jgi:hypothetical protein